MGRSSAPWAGALFPGSAYFDRENTVYYPYSPESAAALLEGLGLQDTNGDGTREFTEGPMAGQDVVIGLEVGEDQTAGISLGPAIVAFLQDVGIKVNFRTIASTAGTDNDRTGNWEMRVYPPRPGTGAAECALPRNCAADARPSGTAPLKVRSPPTSMLISRSSLSRSRGVLLATDFDTRGRALMSELNHLYTDNVYNLGVIVGRYGLDAQEALQECPGWHTGVPLPVGRQQLHSGADLAASRSTAPIKGRARSTRRVCLTLMAAATIQMVSPVSWRPANSRSL